MALTKEQIAIRDKFIDSLIKDESINWLDSREAARDILYLYGTTLSTKYYYAIGYKQFLDLVGFEFKSN
jgi:hypothetical protein